MDRTNKAGFIINAYPSHFPDEHWVALFYKRFGPFEYIDSFGMPPHHTEIKLFIKRNSDHPYAYNTRMLQQILCNVCSLYVVFLFITKPALVL